MLSSLNIEKPRSVREQIAEHVRELIMSGQLAAGAKLPSTRDLADQWGVRPTTAQEALSRLVQEGLLDRSPRVGTFVRRRDTALECVAIYMPQEVWEYPNEGFLHALCRALLSELKQLDLAATVRFNPAQGIALDLPWPELVKAARNREFQSLIALSIGPQQVDWLRRLPVPTAFLTESPVPNRVGSDYVQFCAASLDALQAQGCRSVGLITSMELFDSSEPERELKPFHRYFRQAADERGIEWRAEWCKAMECWTPFNGETLGYDYFRELWQRPRRPEGLIVLTDTVARGVLMAITSLQVDVPRDLKLVLHRNREVGLLCPVPATFIDVSVTEMARALTRMVVQQFNGEMVEPVVLPYRVSGSGEMERSEEAGTTTKKELGDE